MKRWIPFRYYNNNITVKLLSNSFKRCLVNDKCTYLDILKYNNWLCLHLGGPSKNMNETWMIMEINLTLLIAFNSTPDNESWILFEYWALNFNWSEMEYTTHFWWIFLVDSIQMIYFGWILDILWLLQIYQIIWIMRFYENLSKGIHWYVTSYFLPTRNFCLLGAKERSFWQLACDFNLYGPDFNKARKCNRC